MDDVANEEWDKIVLELDAIGVLSRADGKALSGYCHYYSQWKKATADIDRLGLLIEEPIVSRMTGEVLGYKYKRNPAISIANDAYKLMHKALVEFGLTPSSRGRLRIDGKPEEEDPLDAMFTVAKPVKKAHVN